jgi:hypothetical protein
VEAEIGGGSLSLSRKQALAEKERQTFFASTTHFLPLSLVFCLNHPFSASAAYFLRPPPILWPPDPLPFFVLITNFLSLPTARFSSPFLLNFFYSFHCLF